MHSQDETVISSLYDPSQITFPEAQHFANVVNLIPEEESLLLAKISWYVSQRYGQHGQIIVYSNHIAILSKPHDLTQFAMAFMICLNDLLKA